MNFKSNPNNQEPLDRLIDENAFLRSALEKNDQGKELIQQREEFSLLLAVSKLIVSELNLDRVFQLVADKARELVQADMLLVPMLNEQRDRYTYRAAAGPDAEAVLETSFPVTAGMCGWVLRNERSLLFGEASACWLDETTTWERGQQSAVLVPLFGRKRIIGGLSALGKKGGGSFTPHDLDLLTMFANQVSTAIENAALFHQVQREMEERRQAEMALRQSDARLRTLVQTIPDLIWLKDADGVYLSCNPVFERLYGATEADIIGKTDYDFVSKEEADFFREHDRKAMAAGRPSSNEEWLTFADTGYRGRFDTIKTPMYDAGGALIGVLGIARDITERTRAEEQIVRSLKEKEVMLKEIHHRVKNNMQVIYSLLNLQAKSIVDTKIRAMFEESRNRVNSMSLIHEKLYRSADLAHVDFKEYLQSLVSGIADTYKRHDVVITVDADDIALDVNVGIPCGLMVNELVSNSLKHAFPAGRKGTIRIGLSAGDGNYVLTVSDDGIGIPAEVDFRNTSSLGLQLVDVLAGQIHATIVLARTGGTRFSITFPGKPESKGDQQHG